MDLAALLKKNFVLVPVVASVLVGTFTGVKYVVNLTDTINENKAEIEKFLRFETDTPNTIIRPTYIIGKGDHHKRIDYFLDCIKNKCDIHLSEFGDKKLSFVFKEDVAEVIYEVVVNGVVNKTYNICNDEDVTMMELIELFFKITQDKTTIKTLESDAIFKDEECIFSNELVKQDLGIEFKTLEDGIREYILSKS